MTSPVQIVDAEPLLRPSVKQLRIAPELGVLATLDAILATAAYQVLSGHPALSLEAMAHGDLPSARARYACRLVFRLCDLRAAIRNYRDIALHDGEFAENDELNMLF